MSKVALMSVAQGIDKVVTDRFVKCISKTHSDLDVFLLSDESLVDAPFSKAKLLNSGIKKLRDYDIIVQADIDLIPHPKLIEHSLKVLSKFENICFHTDHRRIDAHSLPDLPEKYEDIDWQKISKFKTEPASGCWNVMRTPDWFKSGGYNEYMIYWGKEDVVFMKTCSERGIKYHVDNTYPLIHFNHPPRNPDYRKYNMQMHEKAKKENITSWLT